MSGEEPVLAVGWFERADSEPHQTTLHPVDNSRPLGDQVLALSVRAFGIFSSIVGIAAMLQ